MKMDYKVFDRDANSYDITKWICFNAKSDEVNIPYSGRLSILNCFCKSYDEAMKVLIDYDNYDDKGYRDLAIPFIDQSDELKILVRYLYHN